MPAKKIAAAVVLLLLLLIGTSIVRVTEPAYCGGRFLAPGVHLRRPLAPVRPYAAGELEARAEREIAGQAGLRRPVSVTLRYTWDLGDLAGRPVDPAGLPEVLGDLLAGLDGRLPHRDPGRRVVAELREALGELPLEAVDLEVRYPGIELEELRAADRPTGAKVVVVGFDGLDWGLLGPMIEAGRLPTFARFRNRGAWAEIVSHPPILSPLLWTSIATGRDPEIHGIVDFVVKDSETGRDVPITNRYREVHAFWNILSFLRRDVNIVNWWASHPAEAVHGVMVSERPFYQLFGIRPQLEDPANYWPPNVGADLGALLVSADEIGYDDVRRFADIDRDLYERAVATAAGDANPFRHRINHLRKILATTRGVFNVAHRLLEEHPADLLALYVEGTDTVGHRFAHFLPPKLPWVDGKNFDAYRDTMPRFYEECDRELGRLMAAAPADVTWIVTSDHGFLTGRARPGLPPDDFVEGAGQWHRKVGAFLAVGPLVRPGKVPHADIYDLARTLLWLQGAPISRELEGRELVELVRPEWAEHHPPVYVDSYSRLDRPWLAAPARQAEESAAIDEERLRELQALGYLGADRGPAGRGTTDEEEMATTGPPPIVITGDPDRGAGETEAKPTALFNRAKLAQERGDLESAVRLYEEAIALRPGFVFAMLELYGIYASEGNATRALLWLGRALLTDNDRLPPDLPVAFIRAAMAADRLDEASRILEQLPPRWRQTSSYHVARALALQHQGKLGEAFPALREALTLDPADTDALAIVLEGAELDPRIQVDPFLEPAYASLRTDLRGLGDLARLCLRRQQPEWAERLFRDVLESTPNDAAVLRNLALALEIRGAYGDMIEPLERSLYFDPDSTRTLFTMARARAHLGRHEEALVHFHRAREIGLDGPAFSAAEARSLMATGRAEEARRLLEAALQRFEDGDTAPLREALAEL